MVWGYITSTGIFKIFRVTGNITAIKYVKLLHEKAFDSIISNGFNLSEIIFMQDNAAPHTAKYTKEYFKNQNICVLDWPPQSPDLNHD